MTSPTTPDGIVRWTTSDPASLVSESQAQGDSIQAALNRRGVYSYYWPTSAERIAQTGMRAGSLGYEASTDVTWRYNGSIWRLWSKQVTAFTPTWQNFNVGNGAVQAVYWISEGVITVDVGVYSGTTTAITSTDPFPIGPYALGLPAVWHIIGQFTLSVPGVGRFFGDIGYVTYPQVTVGLVTSNQVLMTTVSNTLFPSWNPSAGGQHIAWRYSGPIS